MSPFCAPEVNLTQSISCPQLSNRDSDPCWTLPKPTEEFVKRSQSAIGHGMLKITQPEAHEVDHITFLILHPRTSRKKN